MAKDFRDDREWAPFLLEIPEVLGLNALTETAMMLRMTVRVIPEYQWKVQRELLRRIKLELDANDIAAPIAPPQPAPVAQPRS